LALALTRGKLSYPSVVILDENLNIIQPIQGFVERDKFSKILVYFALDKYKRMPWVTFERNFYNDSDLVKEH
jgi:thioredoxin-related protein